MVMNSRSAGLGLVLGLGLRLDLISVVQKCGTPYLPFCTADLLRPGSMSSFLLAQPVSTHRSS